MSTARSLLRTVYSVLREIFDESAYARFLASRSALLSGESYSEFLRHKHGGHTPRRCC